MQVLSINIGEPREIEYRGSTVKTGIFKQPVEGPVQLTRLSLAGDTQCDLQVHGGVDQAVYLYDVSDYEYWQQSESWEGLEFGRLGENLTVTGMPGDRVCIGDEYQIGAARVQVSHPRVPCFKLGIAVGDASFVKRFHDAGRVGFYVRILEEGPVEAGDSIQPIRKGAGEMTVAAVFRIMHLDKSDIDGARRASELSALTLAWRERLLERLA